MGKRTRWCKQRISRTLIGPEVLEDRRVLTLLGGLGGMLLQPPAPVNLADPVTAVVADLTPSTGGLEITPLTGPIDGVLAPATEATEQLINSTELPGLSTQLHLDLTTTADNGIGLQTAVFLAVESTLVPDIVADVDLAVTAADGSSLLDVAASTVFEVDLPGNLLPDVTLSADADLGMPSSTLLPDLNVGLNAGIDSPERSLLPDLDLTLGAGLQPSDSSLLPGLVLNVDASINGAEMGLLPGIDLDLEVGLQPADGSHLPELIVDGGITIDGPGPDVLPDIDLVVDIQPSPPGDGLGMDDIALPPTEVEGAGLDSHRNVAVAADGHLPQGQLAFVSPWSVSTEPSAVAEEQVSDEEATAQEMDLLWSLIGMLEFPPDGDALPEEHLAETSDESAPRIGEAGSVEATVAFGMAAQQATGLPAAGLIQQVDLDGMDLEAALQQLLDALGGLAVWLADSGLLPWLLTLAAALAAGELARRSLRRTPESADVVPAWGVLAPWQVTGLAGVTD